MPLGSLRRFFAQHTPAGKRLMVGISGGPDSMALFDAAARLQRELDFELIGAHVDHAWHPQSQQLATQIKTYVEGRGFQCLLHRLAPPGLNNREEQGRLGRLQFFKTVSHELSIDAVMLAHQADDIVETVLKRVLEGAAIDKLHGLRPAHYIDEVLVWRPLLEVTRSNIIKYCKQRVLPVVEDPANQDPRYLRSRMRTELLPTLERLFGKNIRRPLRLLAARSAVLEKGLNDQCDVQQLKSALNAVDKQRISHA